MELKVYRNQFTDKSTIGDLYLNDKLFCHTLEDVVRKDGVKIYGETAIPEGKYKVVLSFSNRFQQYMPEVLNVPGFKGIRIHSGNTNTDTHGCLLIGQKKFLDRIEESKIAYQRLLAELKKVEKKELITIEYINEPIQN